MTQFERMAKDLDWYPSYHRSFSPGQRKNWAIVSDSSGQIG
jgi:hypothetical protein